jgi:hypothetical protein
LLRHQLFSAEDFPGIQEIYDITFFFVTDGGAKKQVLALGKFLMLILHF